MKLLRSQPEDVLFVVKIRQEAGGGIDPGPHGEAVNASTRERRFFSNYGGLCDIIEGWRNNSRL
jgi:hypothetical protein